MHALWSPHDELVGAGQPGPLLAVPVLQPHPFVTLQRGFPAARRCTPRGCSRARLAGEPELAPAFESWDEGDPATALEALQDALADTERRDLVRRVMVAIFTELGSDHPLAREHRRRLSAALN
jgi:hypothetical protein